VREEAIFNSKLDDMEKRRQSLLTELRTVQDKIAQLKHDEQELLLLKPLIDKTINTLQNNSDNWQTVQQLPVPSIYEQVEQTFQQTFDAIQTNKVTQARLQGEQSAYQRLLDVLQPYAERTKTLPSPVANKPMSHTGWEEFIQTIQDNIKQQPVELQKLKNQQVELNQRHF
jgi:chromosome segregation ATPase